MANPIYDLLVPALSADHSQASTPGYDRAISSYLSRLSTLSLSELTSTEPQSLSQASQTIPRSLQALAKRSHKAIITSTDHLSSLSKTLPQLATATAALCDALPTLEDGAAKFSEKYGRTSEHEVLERRRKRMLLARNVDRISDILDLPSYLSAAITSSAGTAKTSNAGTDGSTVTSYASALDLHAHIRRLHNVYPDSKLVCSIYAQAEEAMRGMTSNLITNLRTQGLKLAGAMRTVGWLRRLAPELEDTLNAQKRLATPSTEGSLGAVFLVCRLANLISMLDALEPLRELADQETHARLQKTKLVNEATRHDTGAFAGQQTERYLKRYIEISREQSFAIISMYTSIFPSAVPHFAAKEGQERRAADFQTSELRSFTDKAADVDFNTDDLLRPLPSALSTFPLHLVSSLAETLEHYLPNVQDRGSRDSLLTQVLYCAGSLGRLGGDFGLMLSLIGEPEEDDVDESNTEPPEWVEVTKKHRVQASRLELLASGFGSGRKASASVIDLQLPPEA